MNSVYVLTYDKIYENASTMTLVKHISNLSSNILGIHTSRNVSMVIPLTRNVYVDIDVTY